MLRDLEAKALSVGSDPDGGYLVPDELERAVILDGTTLKRTLATTTPAATYTAAQQTADFGAPQPSIALHVYELSTVFGRGTPRAATL